MAEQPVNQNSPDEIDLGQLFRIIGLGFQKFFNFIGNIFKGLFHLLILFILLVQKHFIILTVVVVVGVAGGFFLDNYSTEKNYISKMVVEPNFHSARQLYNNIDFYNDLAETQDSTTLATALNITEHEALSIKEIFVDSFEDENQKIVVFDDFIKTLDSTTIKTIEIDFDDYLKNFIELDNRFHQISVVSTDDKVAKKIQPAIISSISDNDYFRLQKEVAHKNIALQESIYNKQLIEIDSIQNLYKRVLEKEAEKPVQGGTNINLAGNRESQSKELELVRERDFIKEKLVELNKEWAKTSEVLNVISDFPAKGLKQKGLLVNYVVKLPLLLLGAVFLTLSLRPLGNYLKNYKGRVK